MAKANNGHGGARAGAGRPAVPINPSRVQSLRAQGMPISTIAERLGVSSGPVYRVINELKTKGLL